MKGKKASEDEDNIQEEIPTIDNMLPKIIETSTPSSYSVFKIFRTIKLIGPYFPLILSSVYSYYAGDGPARRSWPLHFHITMNIIKEWFRKNNNGSIETMQKLSFAKYPPFFNCVIEEFYIERSKDAVEFCRGITNNFPVEGELVGFDGLNQKIAFSGPGVLSEWIIHPDYKKSDTVFLYFHGGAYLFGSSGVYRPMLSIIAKHAKCKILSVNYRLAPQNPFPCGLIDALSSYSYLVNTLNIPASNICIGGDSAGGGLTLSLLLALRKMNDPIQWPLPAGAVGFSPWCDLTHSLPSFLLNGRTDYLPAGLKDEKLVEIGQKNHYCHDEDLKNPFVSPIFADSLGGLSPLLIQVGEVERLKDEVSLFCSRAATMGWTKNTGNMKSTLVQYEIYQDQPHVFQHFLHTKPAIRSLKRTAKFIVQATRRPETLNIAYNAFVDHNAKVVKIFGYDGKEKRYEDINFIFADGDLTGNIRSKL